MSEDGSYCLFYGVSSLGVTGWFRYDCNDNTIQVYSVMSAPAANLITQTESQGVSAASDRMWKVVALVLSAVVVLCIIAIVMLAVKLSKSKRAFAAAADDGYDRYDDDEYDLILMKKMMMKIYLRTCWQIKKMKSRKTMKMRSYVRFQKH